MARLKWLNCLMAWLKTGSWFQSFLPSLGNEKNRKLAIFWMNRKDSQKGLKGLPDLTYFTQNGDLGIAWDMFRIFANYEVVLVVSPLEKNRPLRSLLPENSPRHRDGLPKWPQCDGLGPELLTLTISYPMIFIMANYTVGTWILMMHLLLPKWTVKWKMIVVLGLRRTSMSKKSKVLRVAMPHVPGFRAKCCHSFGQVMRWKNVGVYGTLVHKSPKPKWENSQNSGS